MKSKEQIAEQIKARFSSVRERAGVLAQALKVRAEIAAAKRRLRSAYADLGEEIYARLAAEKAGALQKDEMLQEFRTRIDGVKAEVRQRQRALAEILEEEPAAGPDAETDAAQDEKPTPAPGSTGKTG